MKVDIYFEGKFINSVNCDQLMFVENELICYKIVNECQSDIVGVIPKNYLAIVK